MEHCPDAKEFQHFCCQASTQCCLCLRRCKSSPSESSGTYQFILEASLYSNISQERKRAGYLS